MAQKVGRREIYSPVPPPSKQRLIAIIITNIRVTLLKPCFNSFKQIVKSSMDSSVLIIY